MKYTQVPADTFKQIQLNAGVIASAFAPDTGTLERDNIIGATSGGCSFEAVPEYTDFGEDIDNVPKNTKELMRIEDWEITMSGTLVAVTPEAARFMASAADLTSASGKITPRDTLDLTAETGDFRDLWLVADYSDKNVTATGKTAGFVAIHMMDALSTGGFQLQTADKEKGQFSFEFKAHYSKDAQDTVPFEIYIKAGTNS